MASEFEIMDRKQVIIVHDMGEVGRAFRTHFALLVVKLTHFLVEGATAFLYGFHIYHVVAVPSDCFNVGYHGFDLFVAQNRANPSAAGLFQADFFTLDIVKCEVEHPDQGMICSSTGRNHRNIILVFFIFGFSHHFVQYLGKDMAVGRQIPCFVDFDHFPLFFKNYHNLLIRLPLYLQRIKPAKFEEGTKKSAHIRINNNICLRADCTADCLACTRILGYPATWSARNHNFILRIVPLCIRFCCIPQQAEVKSLTSDKFIFHLLAYRLFLYCKVADIDVDSAVVIPFINRSPGVLVPGQEFVGLLKVFKCHMRGFMIYDLRSAKP